jgi:hypothetical protein
MPPWVVEAVMNDFSYVANANIESYVTNANIERFRNLLETSLDETKRQTIQRLLAEELARAAQASKVSGNVRPSALAA